MLQIKDVGLAEAPVVLEIVHAAFAPHVELLKITRELSPHHGAFETLEDIQRRVESGERLVLGYEEAKAVATVRYRIDAEDPLTGHVARLAVLPECRGRHYGRQLVAYAEERMRQIGLKRSVLGIVEPIQGLRRFYEVQEYRVFERITPEHRLFDVLLMEKSLHNSSS